MGYLLAVRKGIRATLLLEVVIELRLGLHPLADIVNDPDGQTPCCLHLQTMGCIKGSARWESSVVPTRDYIDRPLDTVWMKTSWAVQCTRVHATVWLPA